MVILRVLGWRKNKKATVVATLPPEKVLTAKEIDLESMIAINDTGFFDVETEFRDDGANEELVSGHLSNDCCISCPMTYSIGSLRNGTYSSQPGQNRSSPHRMLDPESLWK
jgi:hypothetical protein